MKLTFLPCIFVLALSSCFSSQSYLAVAQEVFQVSNDDNGQLVAEIRVQLEARGFNGDPDFDFRQAGKVKASFWYQHSNGTYGSIDIESPQCIRFAMLIRTDSEDSSIAQTDFAEIVGNLKPSNSWRIPKDHVCPGAA